MNQKIYQDEIENIIIIHAQEITKLKGEELEINKYNEKIKDQVRKLQ
jgi:hypothetical protein